MIEVRRSSDGELCGHVVADDTTWRALTVFGGVLGRHDTASGAEQQVLDEGLASLAERWMYRADPSAEWQVACIQEASPHSVRLALDHYSMPGVPTVTLSRIDLDGVAQLELHPPDLD
ncbi:MAG: hypothetical protein RL238_1338 [Actinomycetota bacterium]|jgi:hypothetical protein